MSSQSENQKNGQVSPQQGPFGWAPFILGLVLPGLGHAFLGERARAWRIAVGFLVLWFGGLFIGGWGSVRMWDPSYASGGKGEQRNLWFIAQAGAGPIAFAFDQIDKATLRTPNKEQSIPVSLTNGTIGTVHKDIAVAIDAGRRAHPERRGEGSKKTGNDVRIRRGATS